MLLSLVIAVMNELDGTRACWDLLLEHTLGDFELVVIDNGSTDGTPEFLDQHVRPRVPRYRYVRNPENVGVWASLQQGYEEAAGDVIAFPHNDVCIYERGWNERVTGYFEAIPDLGLAGFHGSRGCLPGAPWRLDSFSNMADAERHGARLAAEVLPVAVVDGFCLICLRAMLDATGGFDQGYDYHHWYDYDVSLSSLRAGYRNIVVNVPCHHLDGVTSVSPAYQEWINGKLGTPAGNGEALHRNKIRYLEKWSGFLPVYVNDDFSLSRPPV